MPAAHVAYRLSRLAGFVQDLQLLFGCPLPSVGSHQPPPASSSLPPLGEAGKGGTLTQFMTPLSHFGTGNTAGISALDDALTGPLAVSVWEHVNGFSEW